MAEQNTKSRSVIGEVISNKMDKSITVAITRRVRHPKYGKYIRKTSKLHAHDAKNQCNVGDKVLIQECKPVAKTKSWTLVEVLEAVQNQ